MGLPVNAIEDVKNPACWLGHGIDWFSVDGDVGKNGRGRNVQVHAVGTNWKLPLAFTVSNRRQNQCFAEQNCSWRWAAIKIAGGDSTGKWTSRLLVHGDLRPGLRCPVYSADPFSQGVVDELAFFGMVWKTRALAGSWSNPTQ